MDEKTTLPFWNPEWLEAQHQYWDAWASLSQKARAEQVPGAAWAEALDYWWKAVAPAAPGESHDFFTHVIDQAKVFFAISDEFTKFLHDMAETAGSSEYWVEQLDSRFAQMTASIKK
ncbi:MAG: poly(R)-hydroxyalkanoic acid synthase subunit PhaE, partial [Gammaproteobacteria bacterium]